MLRTHKIYYSSSELVKYHPFKAESEISWDINQAENIRGDSHFLKTRILVISSSDHNRQDG